MSRFALVIGNNDYQDPKLARLISPTEDVRDLAEVLQVAEIGGFDQVQVLVNSSVLDVRRAVGRFFSERKPDDLLVLYFSGHGVRDDRGLLYLAVHDTEYELLNATAIPAAYITDEMDRSRSRRQVLILDCCHSGAFAHGAKGVSGAAVGTGVAFEGTGFGRTVLTATDATQYAWEGDQLIGQAENSVFTHFLITGLRTGAADVDADGRITLDELYDYVYEQVVQATPKQTPRKFVYNQQGEVVIAKNPRPSAKPAELAPDLRQAIESPYTGLREGAVRELERLALSNHRGLALAALEALQVLAKDDSQRVSQAAQAALAAYAQAQQLPESPKPQRAEAKPQARDQSEQASEQAEADRPVRSRADGEPLEPEQVPVVKPSQLRGTAERPAFKTLEARPLAPRRGGADLKPNQPAVMRAQLWITAAVVGLGLVAALALWRTGFFAAPLPPTEPAVGSTLPAATGAPTAVTGPTAAPTEAPSATQSGPGLDQPQLPQEFASVVQNHVNNVSAVRTIPLTTQANDDWWFYDSSRPTLSGGRLSLPGTDDWSTAIVRRGRLRDNMGAMLVFSFDGSTSSPGWWEIGVSDEWDQETTYLLLCEDTFRAVAGKYVASDLENVVPLASDPASGFRSALNMEYGLLIARGRQNRLQLVLWRLETPAEQVTFSIDGLAIEPNYVFAKPYPGVRLTIRDFVEIEFEALK